MGCAGSTPAVLVPQQPPATSFLIESFKWDGEATFSMNEYEKSRQGELLPIGAEKVLAQVGGRTFKQGSTSFKEA